MLHLIPKQSIEDKLVHLQELRSHIKILQAEFDMVKQQVIDDYLANNKSYKTAKGLELASYTSYKQNSFNAKRFEKDFPAVFADYKEEKTIYKFLLK